MKTTSPSSPPIEIRVVGPAPYSQEYLAAIIWRERVNIESDPYENTAQEWFPSAQAALDYANRFGVPVTVMIGGQRRES